MMIVLHELTNEILVNPSAIVVAVAGVIGDTILTLTNEDTIKVTESIEEIRILCGVAVERARGCGLAPLVSDMADQMRSESPGLKIVPSANDTKGKP